MTTQILKQARALIVFYDSESGAVVAAATPSTPTLAAIAEKQSTLAEFAETLELPAGADARLVVPQQQIGTLPDEPYQFWRVVTLGDNLTIVSEVEAGGTGVVAKKKGS